MCTLKAGHGELASFLESFCSTAGNSSQQLQFSYRSEVLSEDSADMNCSRIISEGIATLPDAQHNLYSPLITKKKAEPAIDSPDKKIIEQSSGTVSPRIFASPEHTSATSISGNLNLLQAALSSLSLTDKCALSLSLGPSPSSPRMHDSMDVELPMNFGSNFANSDGGSKIFEDIDAVFDSQSVLSEIDMESLDVAMSMMGPQELAKVESEVKLIQSNVRTWILRKNYTNLRDAARVLQTAWRVKKKDGSSDSSASSSRVGVTSPANRKKRRTSEEHIQEVVEMKNGPSYSECNMQLDSSSEKLSSAAATLQAVTRGMLARKTFENAKRQGMASLVIQKSLVHWWMQSKESVIGQGSTQKIS